MSFADSKGDGMINRAVISAVRQLLLYGEVRASDIAGLEVLADLGLLRYSACGERVSGTSLLVTFLQMLGREEAAAGVFALVPDIFTLWLRIVCARLEEAGSLSDCTGLVNMIDNHPFLAEKAVELWTERVLDVSAYVELERELWGFGAHEAQSFPILLRVVSKAAQIRKMSSGLPKVLPRVNVETPEQNWVAGRLLLLPEKKGLFANSAVLSGAVDFLPDYDAMQWALCCPWVFLLGQLVFMQEAWQAERISGGLKLELPADADFCYYPVGIRVVVSLTDGSEVVCGTLGELILLVLADLGVELLTEEISVLQLDEMLSGLIYALQKNRVWTFTATQTGRNAGYCIHPDFSDACYRTRGSCYFYRKGVRVTQAWRRVCERWAGERLVRVRSVGEKESVADEQSI